MNWRVIVDSAVYCAACALVYEGREVVVISMVSAPLSLLTIVVAALHRQVLAVGEDSLQNALFLRIARVTAGYRVFSKIHNARLAPEAPGIDWAGIRYISLNLEMGRGLERVVAIDCRSRRGVRV